MKIRKYIKKWFNNKIEIKFKRKDFLTGILVFLVASFIFSKAFNESIEFILRFWVLYLILTILFKSKSDAIIKIKK